MIKPIRTAFAAVLVTGSLATGAALATAAPAPAASNPLSTAVSSTIAAAMVATAAAPVVVVARAITVCLPATPVWCRSPAPTSMPIAVRCQGRRPTRPA